jgi:hypothetical protein
MARVTKLLLTFPDSQTAQQFSGWLYLEGYPDRVLEQNTVTVQVPRDERDVIIEEAEGRNGRVAGSSRSCASGRFSARRALRRGFGGVSPRSPRGSRQ